MNHGAAAPLLDEFAHVIESARDGAGLLASAVAVVSALLRPDGLAVVRVVDGRPALAASFGLGLEGRFLALWPAAQSRLKAGQAVEAVLGSRAEGYDARALPVLVENELSACLYVERRAATTAAGNVELEKRLAACQRLVSQLAHAGLIAEVVVASDRP